MPELATLLLLITLSMLLVRVGTIALQKTGLSREIAGFQAQSAFMGVGFTTSEAEKVVGHPVRRRILRILMLLGFGAVTSTLGTLVVAFAARESGGLDPGLKTALLLSGVLVLWACARIRPLERLLDGIITRGLERMAHLEVMDFEEMLHLDKGYTVATLPLANGSWLLDKNLNEMALGDEGILILNVERKSGVIIGTPSPTTRLSDGDRIMVYGLAPDLARLRRRDAGEAGDNDHEDARKRQRLRMVEERAVDRIADSEEASDHDQDPQ
ncbi:MAG: potassium transporter TrkA [Planctomycetes bacterium]|jgi:hypothetical protein|nr:potassium transporter TrkA [Planctomycetota bacterium]HJM56184.1 TrkA C-terminal domain-containing protein [Planctomycetota bacterium]